MTTVNSYILQAKAATKGQGSWNGDYCAVHAPLMRLVYNLQLKGISHDERCDWPFCSYKHICYPFSATVRYQYVDGGRSRVEELCFFHRDLLQLKGLDPQWAKDGNFSCAYSPCPPEDERQVRALLEDAQSLRTPALKRSELEQFEKMLNPNNGFSLLDVMSSWLSMVKSTVPIIEDVPEPPPPKKEVRRTPANRRSKKSMRKALKEAQCLINVLEAILLEHETEACVNNQCSDVDKEHVPCEDADGDPSKDCLIHGSRKAFSRLAKWKKTYALRPKKVAV